MKTRTIKGFFGALFCCLLLGALLPGTAMAAGCQNLYIDGVDLLTAQDYTISCGQGTAAYDPASNTLTLTDAEINATENQAIRVVNLTGQMNIVLEGTNTITGPDRGILISGTGDDQVTVQGNGSLNIEVNGDAFQADGAAVIIDGCTLSLTSQSFSSIVAWGGTVTIQNQADVTCACAGVGITGNPAVRIVDSTVKVTASAAEVNAIYAVSGAVTLENAQVTAVTTDAGAYPAIYGAAGVSVIGGTVYAESAGDAAVYSPETVEISGNADVTATAKWAGLQGDVATVVSQSTVNATSTDGHAIFSWGSVRFENAAVTATGNNDAIWGNENVEIIDSKVDVTSLNGGTAIFANLGDTTIEGSIVKVDSPDDFTILANGGYLYLRDSWVESFNGEVNHMPNWTVWENVVSFQDNVGTVEGNVVLPGNATITEDMRLTIPEGASLTVPEGITFTNHGIIKLEGTFQNQGGTVNCDSHIGGAATCTAQAACDICGQPYGALLPHDLTAVAAKEATCTVDGNTAYWHCSVCDKYFSDEACTKEIAPADTVIPAAGHQLTKTEAKEATCTVDGNIAYWHCSVCDKYFSDEVCTKEVALADTVIPAAGHQLIQTEAREATCTVDGNTAYWRCSVCGRYFSDEACAEEITLADTLIPATGHTPSRVEPQAPTTEAVGSTGYWYCAGCGKYFSDEACTHEIALADTVIPKLPKIIAGAEQTWTRGSKDGLAVTSDAPFDGFQKVQVDGKDLDPANYEVKEGSTVVTLKPTYLETLSQGGHSLSIVSDSGTATTTFTIAAKAAANHTDTTDTSNTDSSPKTGDSSLVAVGVVSLVVACGGLLAILLWNRRKNRGK